MRRFIIALIVFGCVSAHAAQAVAQAPAPARASSIEEKTSGMRKLDGFVPMYWDERAGTIWLELSRFNTEILYTTALSTGLGSNDIGLDRGQLGGQHVVKFQKIGPKVLMIETNYNYRASSDNAEERRSVEEAFAKSTLWGFSVVAETGSRVLVDATDFLLRDVHGVMQRLKPASYRLDRTRSAVNLDRTKAFPKNTEMDAILTFVSDGGNEEQAGGGFGAGSLPSVTPSAEAVTLQEHQSFVELPDGNYTPRVYDPRSGFFGIHYQDYSTPIGDAMTKQFIVRHRLKKKDPSAAISDPVQPIIYYLDRGTPEPIRSALLDGARWWNQAFEAAGYRNAFQVEMMPEGADPLDVRYNVIQWVHRSTRGWSYGGGVVDPRTGEMIKGHVTLGSLRVRQDYMLAEGLLSPYTTGDEKPAEPLQMALARLRQLAAHEVGHTLGLGHNYYDSTEGRISVLDYPHPLIKLRPDGTLDLSDAYAVGIGAWDKVSIAWGYQDFPSGTNEHAALNKIVNDAWARDLRYLTNQDLDVSPRVDQWSNGTDPAAELGRMMKVRRAALDRFGETAIRRDMPMAMIEDVFVPLYLHHRYQVEAAASALGGQHYIYALRGDGRDPVKWVPATEQNAALDAILATLKPSELVVPKAVLDKLPPRPDGYPAHRELFPRYTGGSFDPLTPAMTAANLTIGFILQPERAARLVAQHAVDPSLPGLNDVIQRLVTFTFGQVTPTEYEGEIARTVQRVLVDRLIALAGTAPMPQVRAIAQLRLRQLNTRGTSAHMQLIASDIARFLARPAEPARPIAVPAEPPGAPIGEPDLRWMLDDEPVCSRPD